MYWQEITKDIQSDSRIWSEFGGILQEYRWKPGNEMASGSIVSETDRILMLGTYWFSTQLSGT